MNLSGRAHGLAWLVVACVAAPSWLGAQPLTIQHDDVSCLVAGKYPEIHACFEPSQSVARARVVFRAQGTEDWFYVDMKTEDACFKGTLPRPKASVAGIDYYVEATDQAFTESRTREYLPRVVEDESDCEGLVAPYVGTASVVVGALGGTAFPAGFVGGGILGVSAGAAAAAGVAGAAVVGGAVVAGGGDDSSSGPTGGPPPTGGGPGSDPTPGPTTPPATGPDPPPDDGPPPPPADDPPPPPGSDPVGCPEGDDADPEVTILAPSANESVGAMVHVVVEATDPGPVASGIERVVFSADEQGGSRSVAIATFTHSGPRYEVDWVIPDCQGPSDNWYVDVAATDRCGRKTGARVRVKRRMDTCAVGASSEAASTLLWTSELTVPEARTQVTANGLEAAFPGTGVGDLRFTARRGTNRVEGILTGGGGAPGVWRFTVAAGALRPGSLRALAGDVVGLGPATVTFGVRGDEGERVAFEFDVD